MQVPHLGFLDVLKLLVVSKFDFDVSVERCVWVQLYVIFLFLFSRRRGSPPAKPRRRDGVSNYV